jgi:hypothetical protein
MKLIREHINEKFTQEGDPISDMGIGIKHDIKKFLIQNGENKFIHSDELMLVACCAWNKINWAKYLLDIRTDVNVDNSAPLRYAAFSGFIKLMKLLIDYGADINVRSPLNWAIDGKRYEAAKLLLNKGADVHHQDDKALRHAVGHNYVELTRLLLSYGADIHGWHDWILKEKKNCSNQMKKIIDDHLTKEKKKVKESLNEKFTEESDPIEDLGIGLKSMIKKWFISNGATEDQYKKYVIINKEGKIDVSIGLTLTRWVTKEIPNFIQFGVIHGDFDISHCNLTTLRGCPERVFGNFSCSGNDLTSLKYSPQEVKYTYDCRNNKKQFTTREVKKYCKTIGDLIMV